MIPSKLEVGFLILLNGVSEETKYIDVASVMNESSVESIPEFYEVRIVFFHWGMGINVAGNNRTKLKAS